MITKYKRSTRIYLTDQQKKFIETNYRKMTIKQMAEATGTKDSTVYHHVFEKQLDFKRVDKKKVVDRIFKKGCFNPHERENWLV